MNVPNLPLTYNPRISFVPSNDCVSTTGGLLMVGEFLEKIGFNTLEETIFYSEADRKKKYTKAFLLKQAVLQYAAGYLTDDSADFLKSDPALTSILNTDCSSQPTLSRFWNNATAKDVESVWELLEELRAVVYGMHSPTSAIIELDSTLITAYGEQEWKAYNVHYANTGFHPLVAFTNTGEMLRVKLRPGTTYCSVGAAELIDQIVKEIRAVAPDIELEFRADSGFAAPEVYNVLKKHKVRFAVKMKSNSVLEKQALNAVLAGALRPFEISSHDIVRYGEFMYSAGSWEEEQRIVYKISRPAGTFLLDTQFIVTTKKGTPEEIFDFYAQRGNSENFIKEFKESFCQSLPHASSTANEFHFAVQALAYALMFWFRQFCLPEKYQNATAATIRADLIRTIVRFTHSGRYTSVRFNINSTFGHEYEAIRRRLLELPAA